MGRGKRRRVRVRATSAWLPRGGGSCGWRDEHWPRDAQGVGHIVTAGAWAHRRAGAGASAQLWGDLGNDQRTLKFSRASVRGALPTDAQATQRTKAEEEGGERANLQAGGPVRQRKGAALGCSAPRPADPPRKLSAAEPRRRSTRPVEPAAARGGQRSSAERSGQLGAAPGPAHARAQAREAAPCTHHHNPRILAQHQVLRGPHGWGARRGMRREPPAARGPTPAE